MGDREGRPYAGLVAELFGRRGDACRRPCRFPDGLVRVGTGRRKGVARHLARRKRSRAGFEMGDRAPCGRDRVAGWATARVAPTRASSPSCSGVGATLVVAHAGFPMASFGSVRDAARAWHATSHEGNEAVLDSRWATARPAGAIGSRDGRPRGSPLRGPRRRVVRRRGDACRRPCRFPDGLVRVGTGRRKGVARHLVRRKRSRAGFEMGDRAPCGRDRVAGWATARVAPTRASSPSCSGVGATLAVAHAGFPMALFGSVRDANLPDLSAPGPGLAPHSEAPTLCAGPIPAEPSAKRRSAGRTFLPALLPRKGGIGSHIEKSVPQRTLTLRDRQDGV